MSSHVVRCLALALILIVPGVTFAQTASDSGATGRRVSFELTPFNDTLFTAVDGAFRVREDDAGHVWYTTEGGLVHVDPKNGTRELYTKFEGLPSSYSLGLDVKGDKVYVGTDLGLAIITRSTGEIQALTQANSEIPDSIVYDTVLIGDDLWMGTRFFGVAIWNTTRPASDPAAWTVKNTSTTVEYSQPIRRIVPTERAVWVATEGDGAWRYDRATGAWNVTIVDDGLPDTTVLSVAERGNSTWFGTVKGLAARDEKGNWTYFKKASGIGIPDDRVLDVDVIRTAAGTDDIFAATRKGIWQFDPTTGGNRTLAQNYGILGEYVFDNEPGKTSWLFATGRGVSQLAQDGWHYYATGASSGPSWGPLSFGYTSASVGDSGGFLWFGTARGLAAYKPPTPDAKGYWQNFGEWQGYPGTVVNWIDTEGNTTWFGTNAGVYGLSHDTLRWATASTPEMRAIIYGLDAIGDELWIASFNNGLVMQNFTTGIIRTWTYETVANPIPDEYVTDVRVDGNTVWLGTSVGIVKMDRLAGAFRGTYGKSDGIPGGGVVFRVLPEGPVVWVGTSNGGVAKFDVASGKVSRVWNATNDPGFPSGETRALYREGGRLWVGTEQGLARIDVTTGAFKAWNQSNSKLIQNFVNGITSADGILYLATLSGVQRMKITTGEFLPMWDGPGVVRGEVGSSSSGLVGRVSVRIDAPRDGTGVTGLAQVRGSALIFGKSVDRVEVRIGEGPWELANGTETWTFDWDTAGLPANTPVSVSARAFSGNVTGDAEILVTPVDAPTIPLTIDEIIPDVAYAQRALRFGASVAGDEPLAANLFYKTPGASNYVRLPLARQGNLFFGSIPAREMSQGDLRFYLEAQSGLLTQTAAGDAMSPSNLTVLPAPLLALSMTGPLLVDAKAGSEVKFTLDVENVGTKPATFTVHASGLRAAWVSLPLDAVTLAPGDVQQVEARLRVPATAFTDNMTLTFEARDEDSLTDPARASVPVRLQGAEPGTTLTPSTTPSKKSVIPGLDPVLLFAVALVGAFVLRRRRA